MKVKKGTLVWLIISILIIVGEIGLNIYHVINNSINTLDLIFSVLIILVMISNVVAFLEKKDK